MSSQHKKSLKSIAPRYCRDQRYGAFREGEKVNPCNVARRQLPVQKTAALLTSRSWESWEEKGHLGFPCFFYLPSPAELQQPPVRPAHMMSLTGCLSPPPPQAILIPPTQPGESQRYPIHPERLSSMRATGSAPSHNNLCPSHHWGHVDPVDCKAEDGRTPKKCIPAFPRVARLISYPCSTQQK